MPAPMGEGRMYGPRRVDEDDRRRLNESPVKASRVMALFRPYWKRLTLVVFVIVVASLIGLAQPFLLREVIDVALPTGNTSLLAWLCLGMVAVAAVTGLLSLVQAWQATLVGQAVMHDLRARVFRHLLRQSLAFFKATRAGEIQSRLSSDVAGLQSVVTNTATSIAANVTTVIGTLAAMVALNWRLTLVSLAILPPAVLLTRRVALVRRDITAQQQRVFANLYGQVEESLSVNGALLTKTLGTAPARSEEFEATSRELIDLELRAQLAGRWRMATMQIVFAAIPAALYLAAGFPTVSGGISIGTLIAFATLQVAIFRPVMQLLNVGADWIASMALLSRIFGYLDLPVDVPEPAHPVPMPRGAVRGEVHFRDVSYRYPDADVDALTHIELTIPPGRTLAVVGETGSGKSTLALLLGRLADPTSGSITIDGVDLREISSGDLAGFLGVVSQETYLSHDTVAANLRQAVPGATEDELWTALAAAHVDGLIASLPDRLDTVVGARGHRFSGGERQRLAIARTLLSNPRILILDEATSALDNETEREVQLAIDALAVGRTTLTIAHRLTTIQDADEIAVLESGTVIEQGTHEELARAVGRYAQLLSRGLQGPDTTPA
ncbi:MAG: ABC transporter ATP-binding protein [Propionibacteriaceae bacterium]|nr:ABC transporter ATP-binding protein [Micropruina sp.]HBX80173.1 multidrug ABC transporter ATP-binding protein [Propionibacteriaceae bacterium]HBY21878.1 multidrug ABC transporter ATP-binding protein [Propionibacteriaceae bacterium]